MPRMFISVLMVAVCGGLISGCQTSTETYGGRERVTTVPSQNDAFHAMTKTMDRANPEMAQVLKEFQKLGPKAIETLSAEDARKQPTLAMAVREVLRQQDKMTDPQPVGRLDNRSISGPGGSIPIRIYTPSGSGPFPVVVYYHGGGWVFATIDTYDASARALTNAANAIVVSVEYRKAPEHRFPAAHRDAYAAYEWTMANAINIGGDPSAIAVAGESAGGNLAAAVSFIAREREQPMPIHQLLIYPVTGYDFSTPSYQENAQAQPLNRAMMVWFFEKYLNNPQDAKDPLISLIDAPKLLDLPSTTIITADIDPLRSEGHRYAERLRLAGVPVGYRNFEGVTHEFFGMGAAVPAAKEAVQFAADALRRAFAKKNKSRESSSRNEDGSFQSHN